MRRLLSATGHGAEFEEAMLKVFERFDGMLIDGATLADLTAAAAELLESDVFALDVLNDATVSAGASADDHGAAVGRELLRVVGSDQREASRVDVAGTNLAVAALEHARGRLGLVWSPKPAANWDAGDDLIFERYAQAASTAIQQQRRKLVGRPDAAGDSAIEALLAGPLENEHDETSAVRAARLNEQNRYVVLAVAINPPSVVSDAVATAAVGRSLTRLDVWWQAVTVLNVPLIVTTAESEYARTLESAVADGTKSGWRLSIGIGSAVRPARLYESAAQAREALVLGGTGAAGGVTTFESLGALHLLADIPARSLRANPDISAVLSLARSRTGESDLALLTAYCETGSLRRTGDRLFLHHSSVEYRLRRIEARLGFSVATPTGRFRALVATTVVRMTDLTQRS